MTQPENFFTPFEQASMMKDPVILQRLADYHEIQQQQADSIGLESTGNLTRQKELQTMAAAIISEDAELWEQDMPLLLKHANPILEAVEERARRQQVGMVRSTMATMMAAWLNGSSGSGNAGVASMRINLDEQRTIWDRFHLVTSVISENPDVIEAVLHRKN
jgi:hypothetical protein